MNNAMNHRHASMTSKPDKIAEIKKLLILCEKQISLKKDEGGPVSWCASFDESNNQFFVDSIFSDEESLAFHQNNIGSILKNLPPLLATPPDTTIHTVFAVAQ